MRIPLNRLSYFALILLIGVVSGCNRSTSSTPDQDTISATPAQPQAAKPEPPPANATGKTIPKPPRVSAEITPEAKLKLQEVQAELGGGTSLPKNFPKDVPIYPGARIEAGGRMGKDVAVTLKTSDSPDQVQEFYQKALQRQGWKVEVTGFAVRTVTARKAERECTVGIDADTIAGGTLVGLSVTPEK